MPDARYPTLGEFWKRLEVRRAEPDLRAALEGRVHREEHGTPRLGPSRAAVAAAVALRMLPGSAVPGAALASFLDATFDRQLGRGDERAGVLPTGSLIPAGLDRIDEQAQRLHDRGFAELGDAEQDALLRRAERGELETAEGFDWTVWFRRLRGKLLLGYGSDPRGMVQMGFPGPSYRSGHVWLDRGEVLGRVKRTPGYLQL
jgi:gluconate 2-dehydrogenase subunit 3-like protein